jgi:hypothetical protein
MPHARRRVEQGTLAQKRVERGLPILLKSDSVDFKQLAGSKRSSVSPIRLRPLNSDISDTQILGRHRSLPGAQEDLPGRTRQGTGNMSLPNPISGTIVDMK